MQGQPIAMGILGNGRDRAYLCERSTADRLRARQRRGVAQQGSADRFADEFGIATRHPSYESLVADPNVDVVYVATPDPMHRDDAILALRAGKPVLVKKPFAMNAAEAREIGAAARETALFAMEAMWTRFLPHVAVIRGWLADGALGDVVTVTADHGQWSAEDPELRLFAAESR
jgi:predicted dehydrogenase